MPRIFDNITEYLSEALQQTLVSARRADFCVGYFNLRGWKEIDSQIEKFAGGEGNQCRLLVGMPVGPEQELKEALSFSESGRIDNSEALKMAKKLAESFRNQLCYGVPTDADEAGLRRLARQLKSGKLAVKLFLRHPLHAKLYLVFREDYSNPAIGYVGSSNLTMAGLSRQGELNVDVLDHDAAGKLSGWFNDRWNDRFCLDITSELIEIIEASWAREKMLPPYHIYLKIAYTLSQEARTGVAEEVLPERFEKDLFQFQKEAVKIAAHHLKKRGGVLIGDVVGLGKTITATALASLFQQDWRILVVCPKNLKGMWKDYADEYRILLDILSITEAHKLAEMKRYHLIIIDESHNLRNREGKRYRLIKEYIDKNDSKVILLSATPYNKTYSDLGNQLRLFIDETADIGIAPEAFIREKGETELSRLECQPRTLKAFEHSEYADDWRELMRLYLVRRTRGFIKDNYAKTDEKNGRKYLLFPNGGRSYFPDRIPKTLTFSADERDAADQYAALYSDKVVKAISRLTLPRYGLGNYIEPDRGEPPTSNEARIMENLSRAGKRLMGFCRTGLFKRLESSGEVFIRSLERHVLRNYVFLHALENRLPLPIGAQDVEMLDSRIDDDDERAGQLEGMEEPAYLLRTEEDFRKRAAAIYAGYVKDAGDRFQWIGAQHFIADLAVHLKEDAKAVMDILKKHGDWNPGQDHKLLRLKELLTRRHPDDKVLVFTQFADTARYLETHLKAAGLSRTAAVTGDDENPTALARHFSPHSNYTVVGEKDELRVLIATDVLSEGQNLQDAHIIVNYDLPWAIIRLIQRAGRVDRIGQKNDQILCYSFMPADGVEKIIKLRSRVQERLTQNAEVVGSDEAFFEGQERPSVLRDLYNEKAGILDGEGDAEVDLASEAYQIWKNAVDLDPSLETAIPELPNVVYSARPWEPQPDLPAGVLVFMKTAQENCALAWMDSKGNSVTESQFRILKAAKCEPDTPAAQKADNHHALVQQGVELMIRENRSVSGSLGSPRGIRFRTYEKLKLYLEDTKGELFSTAELQKALQQIYDVPLTERAKSVLGQHLRQGISAGGFASAVQALYEENRLCEEKHGESGNEPQLICSLGLINTEGAGGS